MPSPISFAARLASLIQKRPLLFNGISGGFLSAASDGVTQQYEKSWKRSGRTRENESNHVTKHDNPKRNPGQELTEPTVSLDWARLCSAGAIGAFFGGCVYPHAYAKLDAIWPRTTLASVVKKSFTEIATVGVIVNSSSMLCRGLCRHDKDAMEVFVHVTRELPIVTRNDFLIWTPYNMLAFSVIPAFIRPSVTLCLEGAWQAYISFRAHDFEDTMDEHRNSNLFQQQNNENLDLNRSNPRSAARI